MGKPFIQRVSKVVKKVDMLSQPFEIKPKSEERNGTFCGGLISLLFAAFIIVYYIYKYEEQTENNKTLYFGATDYHSVGLSLNQKSVRLMITFTQNVNDNLEYLKYKDIQPYIQLKVENNQNQRMINNQDQLIVQKNIKQIGFGGCNHEQMDLFAIPWGESITDEAFLCLQDSYSIQGKYQDDLFKYLKISVDRCSNETSEQICASQDDINEQLQKIQVNIMVLDAHVDKGSHDSNGNNNDLQHGQIHFKYQNFYQNLNLLEFSQQYDIFMKGIKIEEIREEALLMDPEQVLVESGTQIDKYDLHLSRYVFFYNYYVFMYFFFNLYTIQIYKNTYNGNLASFYIRYESQSITYFRRQQSGYLKFLVAITTIGGLIAAFTTTLAALYRVYHKHHMYVYLMSKTFTFDHFNPKEKVLTEDQKISLLEKQKINYNFGLYIIVGIITVFDNISYLLRNKKTSMRKCLPYKFYLYEIAKNKIKRDLGLKNVLRLLYDVDKLKWLLMSQDQMIIFNSLAKPVLLFVFFKQKSQVISKENVMKNSRNSIQKMNQMSQKKRNALKHAQVHDFYDNQFDREIKMNVSARRQSKVLQNFGTINLNIKRVQGGIFDAQVIDNALSIRVQDAFKHLLENKNQTNQNISEGLILMTQMNRKQFKRIYGLNFDQCLDCREKMRSQYEEFIKNQENLVASQLKPCIHVKKFQQEHGISGLNTMMTSQKTTGVSDIEVQQQQKSDIKYAESIKENSQEGFRSIQSFAELEIQDKEMQVHEDQDNKQYANDRQIITIGQNYIKDSNKKDNNMDEIQNVHSESHNSDIDECNGDDNKIQTIRCIQQTKN